MERREKIEQAVKERERVRLDMIPKKWTKREENEFLRVLTGYGVDLQQATAVPTPDWTRFKAMAKLDKKTDETLSDYYKVFIAMCKRQASVRLTEEEKGLEGIIDDISEDHARLVLDRLELLSKLREVIKNPRLDERIKLCQNNFDTPDWWESGRHDKELVRAVLKHGLYRSEYYICHDPEFGFNKSRQQYIKDYEAQQIKLQLNLEAEELENKERIMKLEKIDSTLQVEKLKKEVDDVEIVEEKKEIAKEEDKETSDDKKECVKADPDTDEKKDDSENDDDESATVVSATDDVSVTKVESGDSVTLNESDEQVEEIVDDDKKDVEGEPIEDLTKSDNLKIKEEEDIPEGEGDPDDDEVMKEKEKAVEEECQKQAAELKARFPDLEVIQPSVKVKPTEALKEIKGELEFKYCH